MCPNSAATVAPLLFKRALDLHQMTFAVRAALADLHSLGFERHLQRQLGTDGIHRFTAI